jgi:anti-anti-sigma factor
VTRRPASQLQVTTERHGAAVVVRPTGSLDRESAARLRDVLLRCMAGKPAGIAIDVSRLAVASGTELDVFVTVWMHSTAAPGLPLTLAEPGPELAGMLHDAGISRLIPVCPDTVTALAAVASPAPRPRLWVRLARDAGSAARARRVVAQACRDWGLDRFPERFRDDARLVVSELVSNALRHAGTAPELYLEWTGEQLVVAVGDADPRPPQMLDSPPSAAGGRGVQLVARIAARWGSAPAADGGKLVWASLDPA